MKKTNRLISDKAPTDYFPKLIERAGKDALFAQCIPIDSSLLDVDHYKDFLTERRKRISKRLNEFIANSDVPSIK